MTHPDVNPIPTQIAEVDGMIRHVADTFRLETGFTIDISSIQAKDITQNPNGTISVEYGYEGTSHDGMNYFMRWVSGSLPTNPSVDSAQKQLTFTGEICDNGAHVTRSIGVQRIDLYQSTTS